MTKFENTTSLQALTEQELETLTTAQQALK